MEWCKLRINIKMMHMIMRLDYVFKIVIPLCRSILNTIGRPTQRGGRLMLVPLGELAWSLKEKENAHLGFPTTLTINL